MATYFKFVLDLLPVILFYFSLSLIGTRLDRGFDITDEALYLFYAQDPREYLVALTHSGFYTGVIFNIVGHEILLFRLFGVVGLLLASLWFAINLDQSLVFLIKPNLSLWQRTVQVIVLVSASLFYYSWLGGLLTPSYNWLNLVVLLIAYGCLMSIFFQSNELKTSKTRKLKAFVLGMVTGITIFIKITSGLLLSIIVFLSFAYFYYKKSNKTREYLVIVFCLTMAGIITTFCTHFLFFETPTSLIDGYSKGKYINDILGNGHTLYETMVTAIKDFILLPKNIFYVFGFGKVFFILSAIIFSVLVAINGVFGRIFVTSRAFFLDATTCLIMTILGFSIFEGSIALFNSERPFGYGWDGYPMANQLKYSSSYFAIFGYSFLFISIITNILYNLLYKNNRQHDKSIKSKIHDRNLLVCILCLAPIIYAWGSNNPIIFQSAGAIIFLIAATILLLNSSSNYLEKKQLFVSFFPVILSSWLVFTLDSAMKAPYNLNSPILQQTNEITIGLSNTKLLVDSKTSDYFHEMISRAKFSEFARKQHVIDLTGNSPGVVFALGGKAPGAPWLQGCAKGSEKFAEYFLKDMKHSEIKSAWILIAPKGLCSLPLNLTQKLGLNFPENYELVASATWPQRNELHQLWKPLENHNNI